MSRVSRAYPPSEAYDDRPRRRGGRDYQEVDVDVRESDYRRAPPEYLREDYSRPSHAGPMVVRERTEADYDGYERDRSRPPPPRSSRGGGEEIDVQVHENDYSRAPPPRSRRSGQNREDIEVDYRERSRAPRDYEQESVYVREDDNRRPPPPRTSEREEIIIRREDADAPSPPRSSYHRDRSRTRVNVDVRDREGNNEPPYPRSRSRAPPAEEEEIDVKIKREPSRSRAPRDNRDTLAVRESSRTRRRSMPPPRNVAREREDFVYRRRSPSRPRESEEIVIRQQKTHSPSPSPPAAPTPPPPPPPQVETRPPIVQEVITHHRHIDHGVVHARESPESSPSPPPPQRQKQDLEVDIRRTDAQGNTTEEDIRIRDNENDRRDSQRERRVSRRRSMDSTAPGPVARRSNKEETNINVNIDADFGNQNPDRRLAPARQKPREMWTEVTKDLVSREAVEAQGYQYEETEDFFYVMAYLRYEDVARLVDITEDMRYGRRERIDQIQWERQDPRLSRDSRPPPRRGPPPAERYDGWDEVTHDREVTYEDRSRRGHR